MAYDNFKDVISAIGKGDNEEIKKAFEEYQAHLTVNGIDVGSRKVVAKGLDDLLNDRQNPLQVMVSSLLGVQVHHDLSCEQKEYFLRLKDMITMAPVKECEHTNLAIIALLHGGGFFPTVFVPELYCRDCDLNVTLVTLTRADTRYGRGVAPLGIEMSPELQEGIDRWINGAERKAGASSSTIVADPKGTYDAASKYTGDLSSLKIIDKKKLESLSGI